MTDPAMWVLVIFFWAFNNNGVAIDHIEGFSSEKACDDAVEAIFESSRPAQNNREKRPIPLKATCIEVK